MTQSTSGTRPSRSFGQFMGLIVAGAIVWFLIVVCLSVVVVAVTGGSHAAGDYILGLLQTWFILALFGLFWLLVALVSGAVAWALQGVGVWIRIAVASLLGSLGSLFLITPFLVQGDRTSGLQVEASVAGILPGLAFGTFAAVVARRAPSSPR